MRLFTSILITSFFMPSFLHAQQDAHVHGLAELSIAIEKNQVHIHFSSPSANIVGFEHQAHSKKEQAIALNTLNLLEKPLTLFTFSKANCTEQTTQINMQSILPKTDNNHDDHDHDNHHEHKQKTHSEISAEYHFTCNFTSDIQSVNVNNLFQAFPNIEQIETSWVTSKQSATQQGAITLKSNTTVIHLH